MGDLENDERPMPQPRRLLVCLAGSGGGHVRQLLDLEPAWSRHDYFFVTEDTALGRSIAENHTTEFVTHVALGQARLGAPLRMIAGAIRNFFQSARIIIQRRPDVVISTGAGAVFLAVAWARLLGAKIVMVESFARFDHPSAFSRLAAPFAHHKIVQSKALSAFMPDAEVFDPLEIRPPPPHVKEPLLFATVGATLPFDRLVQMVEALKAAGDIQEDIVAQVGVGGATLHGAETFETLPFERIQEILKRASLVVCHGGTGSLITALREGCRVIAVPRLFERGEHYDNHQAEIASAFAARGLIEIANSPDELREAIKRINARAPVSASTNPVGLINYLDKLLSQWARGR